MKSIDEKLKIDDKNSWTIKDKLCLVSSVLINGDQNWSLISDQLRKIHELENKLQNESEHDIVYSLSECSKQYKLLLNNYGDPKKIYNALSKERLKELDENLKKTSREYDDVYKEIELILSGALDHQLIQCTETVKKPEKDTENVDRQNSENVVGTNNEEKSKDVQINKNHSRKSGVTSKTTSKINSIDFTVVTETKTSRKKSETDSEVRYSEHEKGQAMDIDTSKDDNFSSEDDDSIVDDDDDESALVSHKSSSSNENIEYLTWKPDITSQNQAHDDELNKSTSSVKKLSEQKSDSSIKLKTNVSSEALNTSNKELITSLSTSSSSSDKRSSIDWKPIIDINEKVSNKNDKIVKTGSKQEPSKENKPQRSNSTSDRLKDSLSSSSLLNEQNIQAPENVTEDTSNIPEQSTSSIQTTEDQPSQVKPDTVSEAQVEPSTTTSIQNAEDKEDTVTIKVERLDEDNGISETNLSKEIVQEKQIDEVDDSTKKPEITETNDNLNVASTEIEPTNNVDNNETEMQVSDNLPVKPEEEISENKNEVQANEIEMKESASNLEKPPTEEKSPIVEPTATVEASEVEPSNENNKEKQKENTDVTDSSAKTTEKIEEKTEVPITKPTVNEESDEKDKDEKNIEVTVSIPTEAPPTPVEIKKEKNTRVGRTSSQSRTSKRLSTHENSPNLRTRGLRNSSQNAEKTKTQSISEDNASDDNSNKKSESQENSSNNTDLVSVKEEAKIEAPASIPPENEKLPELVEPSSTILSIKNEPSIITPTIENTENQSNILETKDINKIEENQVKEKRVESESINTKQVDKNENQENISSKFEDEKAYKAWKKSIMMVLSNIASHKHATVFMHPVRDEIAPGYSNVVYRPMDLSTIKKNIENGNIKTTKEFQRDIMLMFTNAIMYNSSNHDVYKITIEMYKEVIHNVEQLLSAQETVNEAKPLRFKETRNSTTSDKDNVEVDSDVANLLGNKSINQLNSNDGAKPEEMETASNSNSSMSTALNNTSNTASTPNAANKKRRVSTEQVKVTTKRRKR